MSMSVDFGKEVLERVLKRGVDEAVLRRGKMLVMSMPRMLGGFLLLDLEGISPVLYSVAAAIRGAFRYGTPIHPSEMPEVDLVVVGSVAVSIYGERLGKGEGVLRARVHNT